MEISSQPWRILDRFSALSGELPRVDEVHVSELTWERFFTDYVEKTRPCVIRGAVADWALRRTWTPEYLKSRLPKLKVLYSRQPTRDELGFKQFQTMAFDAFLDEANDPKTDYLCAPSLILDQTPELLPMREDFGDFPFLGKVPPPRMYCRDRLFMYRNSYTDWHFHNTDETLMCQLKGDKLVALLPPTALSWKQALPLRKLEHLAEGWSQGRAGLELPELSKVTTREGDAVYIPPYWLHAVQSVSEGFGITLARTFGSPHRVVGDWRYPPLRHAVKTLWPRALLRKEGWAWLGTVTSSAVGRLFSP
jgi:hypothetical protein